MCVFMPFSCLLLSLFTSMGKTKASSAGRHMHHTHTTQTYCALMHTHMHTHTCTKVLGLEPMGAFRLSEDIRNAPVGSKPTLF